MVAAKLQTLDRGLEALFLVAQTEGGITTGDIAARLGVNRAIAYRIVATLAEHGMVQRLPSGRVVMGGAAIVLASRSEGNIRAAAQPILEELALATRASAFISMRQGDDYVAIGTADPPDMPLNVQYRMGLRYSIGRAAPGLALMSLRPPRDDDPEAVKRARTDGFAWSQGELQSNAEGIAAPVRVGPDLHAGLEFAVGVVALHKLDREASSRAVMDAAARLGQVLTPPDRPAA